MYTHYIRIGNQTEHIKILYSNFDNACDELDNILFTFFGSSFVPPDRTSIREMMELDSHIEYYSVNNETYILSCLPIIE
jgi:hypothetical protein